MQHKRSLIVLSFVILGGCASTAEITSETNAIVSKQWERLDTAEECCQDYRDIEFVKPDAEGIEFGIREGRARIFETGKSYFAGVDVSRFQGEAVLVVKAQFNKHRRNGLSYIFKPSVVTLNKDLKELGTVQIPLCYAQGWGTRETGYFGLIKIDGGEVWGLVFHSARGEEGTSIKFGNSATTAGGGAIVNVSVDYDLPVAPVGGLEVLRLDKKLQDHLEQKCPGLFR